MGELLGGHLSDGGLFSLDVEADHRCWRGGIEGTVHTYSTYLHTYMHS